MALNEVSYPVTGASGSYQNIFPSQKPLNAAFSRVDRTILSIVSGVDSKVRIQLSSAYTIPDILVGQFVTFTGGGYSLQSSRVVSIISTSLIEVDLPFISGDVSGSFINYKRDYFLEVRYVLPSSASDDQDATELIADYSRIPNQKDGSISANISSPSDLIDPDFEYQTGGAANLFVEYKIQFRESYDLNRSEAWISPAVDVRIMLVHASLDYDGELFTDNALTKRFIKTYPLLYTLINSDINDAGANQFIISISEFDLSEALIVTSELATIVDLNGVYFLYIDTTTFNASTAFIQLTSIESTSNAQFDPAQFDPSQFA